MQRAADRLAAEIAGAHRAAPQAVPAELVVGRTQVLDLCVALQQNATQEVLVEASLRAAASEDASGADRR